jgi:Tfp pilus assembly protein PilO
MTPRRLKMPWAWVALAALLAANALAFVLLLVPVREAHRSLERRTRDLERGVQNLQREARSSDTLLTAMREAEEFLQGFPPRAELVGLKARLTRLAGSLALHVPDTDYRPSELKEAGLTRVTVQMGVEGSYDKIRRFLYELEGMRRFLVVERLSLRDLKGTATLQVQLQLAIYLR